MSQIKIEKAGWEDAAGTGLRGYLKTTYAQLVRTFGEPHSEGDQCKTDAEWTLRINDTICTIYNWKNGPNFTGRAFPGIEDITEWNIGGKPGAEHLVERAIFSGVTIDA